MNVTLDQVAPRFIEMAHSIGMCVVATTSEGGQPRTRVMQPVWEWDGVRVTGWVTTTNSGPKMDDLRALPKLSLTYWWPEQDTCTADCEVDIITDPGELAIAWGRFKNAPEPAGFDPAIHPDWDSSASPTFGVLRLRPSWLRVMPGSMMTSGEGEILSWRAPRLASEGREKLRANAG